MAVTAPSSPAGKPRSAWRSFGASAKCGGLHETLPERPCAISRLQIVWVVGGVVLSVFDATAGWIANISVRIGIGAAKSRRWRTTIRAPSGQGITFVAGEELLQVIRARVNDHVGPPALPPVPESGMAPDGTPPVPKVPPVPSPPAPPEGEAVVEGCEPPVAPRTPFPPSAPSGSPEPQAATSPKISHGSRDVVRDGFFML